MNMQENSQTSQPGVLTDAVEPGGRPVRSGTLLKRIFLVLGAILLLVVGGLVGLVYFNLENNSLVGRFVRDRIVSALQERIDPSLKIAIGAVDIRREDQKTIVRISNFAVRGPEGRGLISAPEGVITLNSMSLLTLRIVPVDVQLDGLKVAVEVDDNGALVVGTGEATGATEPVDTHSSEPAPLEQVKQVIGSGFAGIDAMRNALGGRLPQVSVSNASVALRDRRNGHTYALSGISSTMESREDGMARGRFEVKMRDAAFALSMELNPEKEGEQTFTARTENLQVSDLLVIAGMKAGLLEARQPVDATFTATVDRNGKAQTASAGLSVGAFSFKAGPAPTDVMNISNIAATMTWTDGAKTIALPRVSARFAGSTVTVSGDLEPPERMDGAWAIRLAGKDQVLPGARPGDPDVTVASIRIALSALPAAARLDIDNVAVSGPAGDVSLGGVVWLDDAARSGLKLDVKGSNVDARAALALWPHFAATDVRTYLADTLRGGELPNFTLKLDFPPDVMAQAIQSKPVPEQALAIVWTVNKAVYVPLKGMPPIRDAQGSGTVSGRAAKILVTNGWIDLAGNRRVALSDAVLTVADFAPKRPEARLRARFSASVDALAELVKSPALQPYTPRGMEPQNIKGHGDGEVTVQFRLPDPGEPAGQSRPASAGDVKVAVNAKLTNVSVEKAVGSDRLEGGNFTLSTERDITTLKGDARVFGVPAQVEMRMGGRGPATASLSMVLDDAARARRGIALGSRLTGPVQVKLTAQPGEGDQRDVFVDADLVRASVDDLLPGWQKKAGAPGRLKARLNDVSGGWLLDKLELDAGTLAVRGSLNLGADGTFQKAQFTSFRLSSGDNAKLDAERDGGLTRVTLTGNAFDVRPFLRSLQTGDIDKAGARDTEVALRVTVLSGFSGELITNADLKLALRGTDLRRFDMTGRFDRGPVTAHLKPSAGQGGHLDVESEDAGAFLRFFDLYSRMRGGDLILSVQLSKGKQTGSIFVKDFSLRNEPAMRRLVGDGSAPAHSDSTRLAPEVASRLADGRDVPFTKMTAKFVRTAGRLDVTDAVMWGPNIGGSLSGYLDYQRDRVDLTGTFVPAYTLNNLFAQVPLLGPILGGGRNEGLFAVRYNIVGRVSAPTLNINPLTAIAPGFLRKLIDFRGAGGNAPSAVPRHEQ